MQFTATLPVIGMDIAKHVFQLHVVDAETGEVTRHKLRRDRVTTFFANRQKSLVAMEACGGAHHWARTLQTLGHEVKLLPAKHVRAFVLRDKTDARDAQAIWSDSQEVGSVMCQLVDRFMNVCQSRVLLRFLEARIGFRLPALGQLLQGAHIDIAVVKERLQLGHVAHEKPSILTNAVAAHGSNTLGNVLAQECQNFCLGLLFRQGGCFHFVREPAAAMGSTVPCIHLCQLLIRLVDDQHGAFNARLQRRACHHHSDFQQAVVLGAQARHFTVQPHKVLI